jgi:small GTP-binding protein
MRKVKTVFAGDAGVGKTCIIERAAHDSFQSGSFATVGATNANVQVQCEVGGKPTNVTFNIWDTAGQEKYRSLTPMYFAGAHVAILVFDLSVKETLTCLKEFVGLLQQRAAGDCLYVLVGNKLDLVEKRQVNYELAKDFQMEIGAAFYFETSALNGKGVKEMFEKIAATNGLVFEAEEPDYLAVQDDSPSSLKNQKNCKC